MMITYSLLLVSAGLGFVWLVLLFLFCFCGVHGIRLAKYGWSYQIKKPQKPSSPPPVEKEKAPAPPQEPIYYIVEKKRTRARPKYSEPKEFKFKQD